MDEEPVDELPAVTEGAAADALDAFFEQSLVMLYIGDLLENKLLRVNKEVLRTTGRTEAQILSAPFTDFIHPDDLETTMEDMAELATGKPMVGYRNRHLTADGDVRIFEWTAVPDMKRRLVYAMARDVTDEKRIEEERAELERRLAQARKMESVGRLAGGVAHEFNNMLAVIIGYTDLALEHMDPSDELFVDLQEVAKAAERSAELTEQLLAFARKQTIEPKVLNLDDTIEGMLKMLRQLIGERIDLAWRPDSGSWLLRMDPSQVHQILVNLCVNARDAIADIGEVIVETSTVRLGEASREMHPDSVAGEYVLLAVNDNGSGIDEGTLERMFEPFFTTKESGQGTGLGLATVYGIVQQNGGFIRTHSALEKGTAFEIYLPRYVGPASPGEEESQTGTIAQGRETVLVVEDDPAVLRLVERMLEDQGYLVLAASGPNEAIRLSTTHRDEIHLLMTDLVMPEMNGQDLADRIMSTNSTLRTLYMSGYRADVVAGGGAPQDGMYFIQKPFSARALAAKVREALTRGPVSGQSRGSGVSPR